MANHQDNQAPQLLLLPGLLNDGRLWAHQVEELSGLCIPSVVELTSADSIALLASDALARIPAGRFALAGLSMGGYVALEIMRQAPDRVQALALLDTQARPDTPEATDNRHRLMELAGKDFPKVTETLLPRLVHTHRLDDQALVQVIKDMANDLGEDVFKRQQRAIIDRIDSRPYLPQIDCPTLVLCGREDVITPVHLHQEMADAIPASNMVVIEHCGHLSTLEQPEPVTDAMRAWLEQAASGAR